MFNLNVNVRNKAFSGSFNSLDAKQVINKVVNNINIGQLAGDLSTALHYMTKGESMILSCSDVYGDTVTVKRY